MILALSEFLAGYLTGLGGMLLVALIITAVQNR